MGLTISHIEVTQATQDGDNSVPLIAGKPTFVRVYVDCGEGCSLLQNITGVLRGYGPSGELLGSPSSPVNRSITAFHERWLDQRDFITKTLNFTLPPKWTTGQVTLTAEVGEATLTQTVTFQPARPVNVLYVPISYSGREPDPDRIRQAFYWAQRIYPTAKVNYNYIPGLWFEWGDCFGRDCCSGKYPCLKSEAMEKGMYVVLTWLYAWLHATSQLPWPSEEGGYIFGWLPPGTFMGGAANAYWDLDGTPKGFRKAAFGDADLKAEGIFAHELAHLLGRPHTKVSGPQSCENPTPDVWSDWRYPTAKIDDLGLDGYGFGWLLSAPGVVKNTDETYDYMSYCWYGANLPAWTSSWTYEHIYYETLKLQTTALAVQPVLPPQPYFIASGLVYTDNTATLDPFWVITSTVAPENPPEGTAYCLEAQNTSGTSLVSRCFDLTFVNYGTGEPTNVDGFSLMLPYPPGVARIVLKKGSQELAVRSVSANAPSITVLSPNGGETWAASGTYTITWTASDADGDPLTYSVLYSSDGSNWVPLRIAITETQLTVSAAELAGGSGAKVRVLATDGVNTGADESDAPFTVGRKGPQTFILSPEGDGAVLPGTPLLLQGYAYDLEDGTLGEVALRWTSSRDGDLGTGSQVLVSPSPGQHIITLTATDSDGNQATDSISLFVGYKWYLPYILKNQVTGTGAGR